LFKVNLSPPLNDVELLISLIDMQRFQAPYNLKKIPEVQEYLNVAFENTKNHGDLQDLYRRRCVSSYR